MSQASLNPSAVPLESTSLDPGLRIRLSLMMFLQYAVWGAWYSVLAKYLFAVNFSGAQVGDIYGTLAIASIFAPLVFGQIADRWVPTQYLLVVLHLAGAGVLYLMTQATDFSGFYTRILIYMLMYVPTISLSNALALHHIPDASRHFPGIRVFGTIGWIVIGVIVGKTLNEASAQPITVAMWLSIVLGVYCLTLPHTPPRGKAGEALPFVRALGLLKSPMFALFTLVSFVIAVVLAGYYTFTSTYLGAVGQELDVKSFRDSAAAVMTIGQFTEMIFLPFLPLLLRWFGMKWTLMMGMAAWGIRYWFFSLGEPAALVYIAIALHGVCYDFFFVAAYIHVDNTAGKEIRASAQAMFNLVVMGLGMYLGNKFFGRLVTHFTVDGVVQWSGVWAYPMIGAAVALLLFGFGFRQKKRTPSEEAQAAPAA